MKDVSYLTVKHSDGDHIGLLCHTHISANSNGCDMCPVPITCRHHHVYEASVLSCQMLWTCYCKHSNRTRAVCSSCKKIEAFIVARSCLQSCIGEVWEKLPMKSTLQHAVFSQRQGISWRIFLDVTENIL